MSLGVTFKATQTVHPHECGEHLLHGLLLLALFGSSPRVWGTCCILLVNRFAGYGSSPRVWGTFIKITSWVAWQPVHPHECGEHGKTCPVSVAHIGSSPRVWGTSAGRGDRTAPGRFIPTSVGNMFFKISGCAPCNGSSPRVWGTYSLIVSFSLTKRFIPTSVGNMCIKPFGATMPAVHPHECGEHPKPTHPTTPQIGSSPRVWGTCPVRGMRRRKDRFIPTSVGNIRSYSVSWYHHPVHPHECGEHHYRHVPGSTKHGSSPRVWGTWLALISADTLDTVHPHECGEHASIMIVVLALFRFIPTSVGNMFASYAAHTGLPRFIPTSVGNMPLGLASAT